MRWKLLLITVFVTALGSTVASFGAFALLNYFQVASMRLYSIVSSAILIAAAVVYASIFIYRHNARRRKLQVILAALFSLALAASFIALLIQLRIFPRPF